jgi:hypothetical protein
MAAEQTQRESEWGLWGRLNGFESGATTKLLLLTTLTSAMKKATGRVLGAADVLGPRGNLTAPA